MSVKARKLRNLKKQIEILKWELQALVQAVPSEDWGIIFGKLEGEPIVIPGKSRFSKGNHKGLHKKRSSARPNGSGMWVMEGTFTGRWSMSAPIRASAKKLKLKLKKLLL